MNPEPGVMLFPLARQDTLVQGDFVKSIEAAAIDMKSPVSRENAKELLIREGTVMIKPSPLTIVDLSVTLGAKQFHPL